MIDSIIQLSESAEKRITELQLKPNNQGKHLRVAVFGGGCNGFRYEFSLDDKINDDDFVISHDKRTLLTIDKVSVDFIKGSIVDFTSDIGSAYFKITNPNAKTSCGCGDSFSI